MGQWVLFFSRNFHPREAEEMTSPALESLYLLLFLSLVRKSHTHTTTVTHHPYDGLDIRITHIHRYTLTPKINNNNITAVPLFDDFFLHFSLCLLAYLTREQETCFPHSFFFSFEDFSLKHTLLGLESQIFVLRLFFFAPKDKRPRKKSTTTKCLNSFQ